MKHALFTLAAIAVVSVAAFSIAQQPEAPKTPLRATIEFADQKPEEAPRAPLSPSIEFAGPKTDSSRSAEDQIKAIDFKLALEQYGKVRRMAFNVETQLIEMDVADQASDGARDALRQKAVILNERADRLRAELIKFRMNEELVEERVAPIKGSDVFLTIDARMQNIVETALRDGGVGRGAVVVIDPRSGEVLAMASVPLIE